MSRDPSVTAREKRKAGVLTKLAKEIDKGAVPNFRQKVRAASSDPENAPKAKPGLIYGPGFDTGWIGDG